MKRLSVAVLIGLILVQIAAPVIASTPSSITIGQHQPSVSADQVVQFSATVKDSSGSILSSPINWSATSGHIDSTGLFTPGMIGTSVITAESGGVNSTTSIEVTKGYPFEIRSMFNQTNISIDDTINLNATLVDRAGNSVPGDLTYRSQNGHIDHQNMTWQPDQIGLAILRIIYFELELQVSFNIEAGQPSALEIPYGLTVQSGTTQHIIPIAKDSYGNEVGISKAGTLTWQVENGTISPTGLFFANAPGVWNISVNSSSGAFGSGTIRVLPAQATGLSIGIESTEVRAGSVVSLSAIRSDILGNNGEVEIPLANWSVPTGSLFVEQGKVKWIPSSIGNWTIGVQDQGFSSTILVNVVQGEISGIEVLLSENVLRSGDLIVASITAHDAAGNMRSVDGAWTIAPELSPTDQGDWYELRPGPVGNYSISAVWFDNETQVVHETEKILPILHGDLARIILPQSGTRVASDDVLALNPVFEDEYGNEVDNVPITWIIDDVDMTMEVRLAGDNWAPNSIGMHEIRAMAQGVFAITDVEVIAGTPRYISTSHDGGISVDSGYGIEIQITTTDVHGNSALASEVDFEFDDPLGMVTPSSEGDGYWIVEGGQTGEWNLRMRTGSAVSDITVNVSHGEPVRLLAEISENNPKEGGSMIIRIHAIDQAGNRIEVPSDEVTIKCTAGSVSHLAADTHELSIDQAGDSHSCNVYWNDLIAQRFFDVEAVLFGGGLGDSNTALTMVSMIIFLFIAIMVVLIRRMKGESQDDYEWEDEFEEEEESENVDSDLYEIQNEQTHTVVEETTPAQTEKKESGEDLRAKLAAEAKKTGVMQAAPGTEQGKTGWYVDSTGELTSWLVSETGEWTRVS